MFASRSNYNDVIWKTHFYMFLTKFWESSPQNPFLGRFRRMESESAIKNVQSWQPGVNLSQQRTLTEGSVRSQGKVLVEGHRWLSKPVLESHHIDLLLWIPNPPSVRVFCWDNFFLNFEILVFSGFWSKFRSLRGLKRSGRLFRFTSSYFRPCTSPWFRVMSISVI